MKSFQLVITGSSAKMLSQELATSIAARARTKTIWPLSWAEFLDFNRAKPKDAGEHLHWLGKYSQWGAFPEVVLTENIEEKREILQQYYTDIMIKSVISRGEVRNPRALETLMRHHLLNVSKHSSANALKKAYGFSIDMIHEYMRLVEDAFLLFPVERYHRNLKVKSRDSKKVYAIDNGLRNANSTEFSEDSGNLLENLVYIELRRRFQKIFCNCSAHYA